MISTLRARADRLRAGYLARPYTSVQLLMLSGAVLLTFGALMSVSTSISAATSEGIHGTLWTQMANEVIFVALGVPILWLGARIPPRVYRMLVYPVLVLAAIMLLAVFVPHVGVEINDARRWLKVGPAQVQPSEFAKLAMLLWGADLLARREERGDLRSPRRILFPLVPGFVIVCALVMSEPDLGTTLCFLTLLMGLLWTVGLPYRYFLGVLAAMTAMVTAVAVLDPRRLERLTSFVHPLKDTSGTGAQAIQGLYALSSGGIFGVGLGSGPLKFGWVPNANTDYVFAIIGEELGLLGCLFVLAAFGLFAYAALRVARRSSDCFVRLAASSTAVWICGQALINIGYVTGLLPVTGIPLPFVSAGGTSLVLTMGVLGMLVSFARHEPEAVAVARADAAAGERGGFVRWTRLGVPRVAVPVTPRPVPARPAQKRPAQKRPAEKRPAEKRPAEKRPAPQHSAQQKRPAQARTAGTAPRAPRPVPAAAQAQPVRANGVKPNGVKPNGVKPNGVRPNGVRPGPVAASSAATARPTARAAEHDAPRAAPPLGAPRAAPPLGAPRAAPPLGAPRAAPPQRDPARRAGPPVPRRAPAPPPADPRVRRSG